MKIPMYSIFDKVSARYARPFTEAADGTAVRAFAISIKKGDIHSDYAKDYDLYRVGDFDDESGSFVSDKPRFLVNGAQFIEVVR